MKRLPIDDMNLQVIFGSKAFGERIHPVYRTKAMHYGVDYPAPKGTPIKAVEDGNVIVSKMQNGGGGAGEYIVIRHENGFSYYAHQSKRLAEVNAIVKAGDIIGYVGTTGASTGNHLHFGWCTKFTPSNINNSAWVDPLPLLMEASDMVTKTKIEINGSVKEVDTIQKDGFNFIKLRDLADAIVVDYDADRKLPIVKSKGAK